MKTQLLLAAFWVLPFSAGAIAQTTPPQLAYSQRSVDLPRADALGGNRALDIWIEGGGLNLDLSQLGERINTIILDDTSNIGYSHCLLHQSCGERSQPVIHLRRIKKVESPYNYSSKQTLLTVYTTDSKGGFHTYLFPLRLGDGMAQYNKVSVIPPLASVPTVLAKRPLFPVSQVSHQAPKREIKPQANEGLKVAKITKPERKAFRDESRQLKHERKVFEKERAAFEKQRQDLIQRMKALENRLDEQLNIEESVTPDAIEVLPESLEKVAKTPTKRTVYFEVPAHNRYANSISMGMSHAQREGDLNPDSLEWRQINSAIALLRRGYRLDEVASLSKIPEERLIQLIELGGGWI